MNSLPKNPRCNIPGRPLVWSYTANMHNDPPFAELMPGQDAPKPGHPNPYTQREMKEPTWLIHNIDEESPWFDKVYALSPDGAFFKETPKHTVNPRCTVSFVGANLVDIKVTRDIARLLTVLVPDFSPCRHFSNLMWNNLYDRDTRVRMKDHLVAGRPKVSYGGRLPSSENTVAQFTEYGLDYIPLSAVKNPETGNVLVFSEPSGDDPVGELLPGQARPRTDYHIIQACDGAMMRYPISSWVMYYRWTKGTGKFRIITKKARDVRFKIEKSMPPVAKDFLKSEHMVSFTVDTLTAKLLMHACRQVDINSPLDVFAAAVHRAIYPTLVSRTKLAKESEQLDLTLAYDRAQFREFVKTLSGG